MDYNRRALVEFIVLAEFDINEGSTIRYQYPRPIEKVEEEQIASYMLPEGGHNRASDLTYFILRRKKKTDWLMEGKPFQDPKQLFQRLVGF